MVNSKNKGKYLCRIGGVMLVLVIVWSCEKDNSISPPMDVSASVATADTSTVMKLGKQLENPYSVENMQKAWDNLKASNADIKSKVKAITEEIEATHLYIKFKPKNDEELSILKTDSTLILYDYPLDYEILEMGSYYRDPDIPAEQPTYKYASVKVNKELPNGVDYEKLSELFIPDEDSDEDVQTSNSMAKVLERNDWTDNIVDEALRITDNLEEQGQKSKLFGRKSKWRPAGRIQIWDKNLGRYIGVEGVEVRARRWFTTHKGIARSSGHYSCNGRFRRDANYSIVWERYDFVIRDSWLGRARHNGPKRRGDWNLYYKYGKQAYYSTIFRAAYHYYYKNIKGLRRPPTNSFWKTQLKIRAYYETDDEKNGSHKPARRFLGLGSAIKIYNPQHDPKDTYATVIHELAHASHWNMDRGSYNRSTNVDPKVAESWARGVQWELTRMIYTVYVVSWYCNSGCGSPLSYYTGVVEDMIDGRSDYDQVSGYTIRQIEDALKGSIYWGNWKNNIKTKYSNGTEQNLAALFTHWN